MRAHSPREREARTLCDPYRNRALQRSLSAGVETCPGLPLPRGAQVGHRCPRSLPLRAQDGFLKVWKECPWRISDYGRASPTSTWSGWVSARFGLWPACKTQRVPLGGGLRLPLKRTSPLITVHDGMGLVLAELTPMRPLVANALLCHEQVMRAMTVATRYAKVSAIREAGEGGGS